MKHKSFINLLMALALLFLLGEDLAEARQVKTAAAAPGQSAPQASHAAASGGGYISLPAAAFQPMMNGYSYANDGSYLWGQNSSSDTYVAPLYLPHGARITRITFYWYDSDSSLDGYLRVKCAGDYVYQTLAQLNTFDSSGFNNTSTTSIGYPDVDNAQYAYYLQAYLPFTDMTHNVVLYRVHIEYSFSAYMPLVVR
ncbi:MAG: hypothetical protein JXA78_15410 [Anaerolineales bacterium]|nr:hypothetical protein [Anaerolineales bacterium]